MLGAFMCFYWEKSKVQIRPHSIKSVRFELRGLSAFRGDVDNSVHNTQWLNVPSGWRTSTVYSTVSCLLSPLPLICPLLPSSFILFSPILFSSPHPFTVLSSSFLSSPGFSSPLFFSTPVVPHISSPLLQTCTKTYFHPKLPFQRKSFQ